MRCSKLKELKTFCIVNTLCCISPINAATKIMCIYIFSYVHYSSLYVTHITGM